MKKTKIIFFCLIGIWLVAILGIFAPGLEFILRKGALTIGVSLLILGCSLFREAMKIKDKKLSLWLELTGGSAAMLVLGSILHNLLYGLGMIIKISWLKVVVGGIGAGFFILSVVICPLVFLVTMIGSLVGFPKK